MRIQSLFFVITALFSVTASAQQLNFYDSFPALSKSEALNILNTLVADDEPVCLSYARYAAVAYGCAKTHESDEPAIYTGCVEKFRNNFSFVAEHDEQSQRLLRLVEEQTPEQALAYGVTPARVVVCAMACEGVIHAETNHLYFRGERFRQDLERDCNIETLSPDLAAQFSKSTAGD